MSIISAYKKYSSVPRKILVSYQWRRFTSLIHPDTWRLHDKLLDWASQMEKLSEFNEDEERYIESEDCIVSQGIRLVKAVRAEFADCCKDWLDLKILIHLPPFKLSPGGFSLFNNLLTALSFIGISVRALIWQEDIADVLREFNPNFFITSDSEHYLSRINWAELRRYRKHHNLKLGLTASLEEFGNTPLKPRLKWAKNNGVDFYYSFHSSECLNLRSSYKPFYDQGYRILSVEFGANPLIYYPVPSIDRDINYVFLASSNSEKWPRYFQYLDSIFRESPGLIDGPGWPNIKRWAKNNLHRYLYARAKVGINLHISDSIKWPSELNERTYILAACGVPQLVDSALLLHKRFSKECFFVASNPKEYKELFYFIIHNPLDAKKRALQAQNEVFGKHTCFHRAKYFASQLTEIT